MDNPNRTIVNLESRNYGDYDRSITGRPTILDRCQIHIKYCKKQNNCIIKTNNIKEIKNLFLRQ